MKSVILLSFVLLAALTSALLQEPRVLEVRFGPDGEGEVDSVAGGCNVEQWGKALEKIALDH